ncbi:MAG: tetratricopeptide repeat protein, partial [Bryobacteraceae bacterium]
MRPTALAVLACCVGGLLAGGGRPAKFASQPGLPGDLKQLWHAGANLFAGGRYEEAGAAFEAGARASAARGDERSCAQFLNNLAGCRLARFRYREAVQIYLEARRLAERRRDWKTAAIISSNLATVYAQMGDQPTARSAAEHALELARRACWADAQLLLRVATLRARQGELQAALPLFDEAARLADQLSDPRTLRQAWRTLGYEYLRRGNVGNAERVLLEAFRLDRLAATPELALSYRNLALLHSAQGEPATAERLMDAALATAQAGRSPVPLWTLYFERGRLRRRQGRLGPALEDYRRAADLARRWRTEALPAESSGVSLDVGLQELYGELAETAARLARQTGRRTLAVEAFEAAEENRAASLRARLEEGASETEALPPEYWTLLGELQRAAPETGSGARRGWQRRVE